MPKLTLHFEAAEGTDLEAAAAALQSQLAETQGIESARSRAQRYQSIGPAEIMSVVQVATQVIQTSAALLTALAALHAAWEKVKPMFPGLKPPTVEVGLDKVPVHQVTREQAQELAENC
jgi:K+/H+ antiporter YhaU regulatory subunit KhtT